MTFDTLSAAQDLNPRTIELRRRIHSRPELGLTVPETQAAVLDEISDLGLSIETGRGETTWVVATLDSGRPGNTILLRADMDALPMPEDTEEDFSSQIAGRMHACGHDAHTAMLTSAARLLVDNADQLSGSVVFMFQPGEEGAGGAQIMLEEGLLTNRGIDRAFAIHQTPSMPSGWVGTRPGALLASADQFQLTVNGRGGHASMPHQALDPIPIACQIVGAIQAMMTRRIDVFDPAVVTVAKIWAGSTTNVIPETAIMAGTIRAISEKTRTTVHEELERLATNICAAHGASATMTISTGYPVTINDPDSARWVKSLAEEVVGAVSIELPNPVMGAEDWSYVLRQVPGAMAFVGNLSSRHRPSQRGPKPFQPHDDRRVSHGGRNGPLYPGGLDRLRSPPRGIGALAHGSNAFLGPRTAHPHNRPGCAGAQEQSPRVDN